MNIAIRNGDQRYRIASHGSAEQRGLGRGMLPYGNEAERHERNHQQRASAHTLPSSSNRLRIAEVAADTQLASVEKLSTSRTSLQNGQYHWPLVPLRMCIVVQNKIRSPCLKDGSLAAMATELSSGFLSVETRGRKPSPLR